MLCKLLRGSLADSLCSAEALEVSLQLDKFPKSVLEAYVMVLEDDGGSDGRLRL